VKLAIVVFLCAIILCSSLSDEAMDVEKKQEYSHE